MKLTLPFFLTLYCLVFQYWAQANPVDSDSLSPKKKPVYRASTTKTNDLIHTKLDVKFDWENSQMQGKASITAKPHFKPCSTLILDARGMEIQGLEVFDLGKNKTDNFSANNDILTSKKSNSSYKYENDSLKINLGREFGTDEKYLVRINYLAKPNELKKGGGEAITDDRGLYFINPKGEVKNKMPQIWTQGEIQANSAWFPTIDCPNQKMTSEILITVDAKYTTLSNGSLIESSKNSDGTRTDHWKMDLPHSPYLVMMAIGEFVKINDVPWKGKEISYYVEKEYAPFAKEMFGNTPEMIELYSNLLSTPYPWQKYSQIVVRDYVSGAMENTSATLHSDQLIYQNDREMIDQKKGEPVIAHELFHQWFGDLVTTESWSNLPLNESFATYGEYLWEEYKYGRDAADSHNQDSKAGYFEAAKEKQVELIRFQYNDAEDMFDAFSYNKGGQVMHMLRKYVGDRAFFASLKLYLEKNKFQNAEIHQLRLAFEEITGEDLNWFFEQWFLKKGHPQLSIDKSYDPISKTVKLFIKQKQDLTQFPLYKLPVDVDIYSAGRKERHCIMIDEQNEEFTFYSPVQPDLVNFDAERQLLSKRTYTRSVDEFIFQCRNAPLYLDRYEALRNLSDTLSEARVYELFKETLTKDPFWEIRQLCLESLQSIASSKEAELRPLVLNLALNDKNSNVRSSAIDFLAFNDKGPDLSDLYTRLLNERSYAIASSALKALCKTNSLVALQKAKELEGEKSELLFESIATIYGNYGSDANSGYFEKCKDYFSGYALYNYIKLYGNFLKRCELAQSFRSAAGTFGDLALSSKGYLQKTAQTAFKESILDLLQTRKEELKKKNPDRLENIQELEKLIEELSVEYQRIDVH
ncbi:MAG: M1 family metallopeptidase [bacterium]|nr:M1 family metallopeptidase [bacterium]